MQYGKEMYGIEPPSTEKKPSADGGDDEEEDEEDEDIEKAIARELQDMKASQKPKTRQVFTAVTVGLECLFFMKTMAPVDPVALALKICQDASACADPRQRRCKYVNRLTPVTHTDKSTDNGIDRVAGNALGQWFELVKKEGEEEAQPQQQLKSDGEAYTVWGTRETFRKCVVRFANVVVSVRNSAVDSQQQNEVRGPYQEGCWVHHAEAQGEPDAAGQGHSGRGIPGESPQEVASSTLQAHFTDDYGGGEIRPSVACLSLMARSGKG
jgi:tRNA acetyltransferase TAN1